MILILMYHRIGEGKLTNRQDIFFDHLKYIKDHFPVVLPGDPCSKPLSICLTFDDAFCDFYAIIFPLLVRLQLRAVLGVPTKYILEKTEQPMNKRLQIPYSETMKGDVYQKFAPYCTWQELEEICQSGYVEIASHSHSHPDLTANFDLENEIIKPKNILENRLSQAISTFIYPFGKTNHTIHQKVLNHHAYAMRIGSSLNQGWNNQKRALCRVDGDCLNSPTSVFEPQKMLGYKMKRIFNYLCK